MLTIEELRESFDVGSLTRGISYAKNNKVLDALILHQHQNEFKLFGTVSGSHREIYQVSIEMNSTDVDAECSCPVGYNCKHAVAVILSLKNNQQQPKVATLNLNTPLDFQLERFLDNSIKLAKPKLEVQETICYILEIGEDFQGKVVKVTPQSVRKLKNGGMGKPKYFYPNTENRQALLSSLDRNAFAIMDLYTDHSSYGSDPYTLNTQYFTQILEVLLATGQCYWLNTKSKPLSLGENLQIDFTWQVKPSGHQYLAPNQMPEDILFLPTYPLHYLNESKSEIGLIKHNFPQALTPLLVNNPYIPPTQVKAFKQKIEKSFPQVPQPMVYNETRHEKYTPTPCLKVYQAEIEFWEDEWSDKILKDPCVLAELTFDYGGVKFYSNSDVRSHTKVEDASIIQIPRDFITEGEKVRFLEDEAELGALAEMAGVVRGMRDNQKFANSYFVCQSFDAQNLHWFKEEIIPVLEKNNWKIEFEDNQLFQPMLEFDDWYTELSESSGENWFNLELGILLEGERVDLLPLLVKAVHNSSLVEGTNKQILLSVPDKGLVPIPQKRLDKIMHVISQLLVFDSKKQEYSIQVSKQKAALLIQMEKAFKASELRRFGDERLFVLGKQLTNFKKIKKAIVPKTFAAQLRPYQQEGVNWIQFLRQYELSGILADDMGLGKTIQALAHLSIEKQKKRLKKPSLIIAPTSVVYNWAREIETFSKNLTFIIWHGDKRKENKSKLEQVDLVLSTYPLLVRDKELLLEYEFYYLILDEAQTIKNAQAKMTQVVQQLKASHRLCLTGTPLENHLGELWSQFNFLMPGLLGNHRQFKSQFRTPIEKHQDKNSQKQLSLLIRPFMLRRTKQEVVTELPEKSEIIQTVELNKEQRDLYETIRLSMNKKIKKAIDEKGIERSQIIILDALLKLRQVCCHPKLLKIEAAKNIKASAKLEALKDMLQEMVEEGRKILLFSQFTSMLSIIETELIKSDIAYVKLTGNTKDRAKPIAKFQDGSTPIFLISLKAGGTGLNLTAADTVIHFDPWWNPAVENQATDRAHRIGQTKAVFVYKFVCSNTVEEKILVMQAKKKALMDAIFSGGTHKGSITKSDLDMLFSE